MSLRDDKNPSWSALSLSSKALIMACIAIAILILIFIGWCIAATIGSSMKDEPEYHTFNYEVCDVTDAWWSDAKLLDVWNGGVFFVPVELAEDLRPTVGNLYEVTFTFDGGFMNYLLTLGDNTRQVTQITELSHEPFGYIDCEDD